MAHFNNEDIEGSLMYDLGYSTRRHLKPGIVPSIIERYKDEKTLLREERATKRNNKKIVDTLLKETELKNPLNEKPIENPEEILDLKSSSTQKDETNPLEDRPFEISLLPTQFSIPTKHIHPESELLLNDDHIEFNEIEECEEYNLDSIEPIVVVESLNKQVELLTKERDDLRRQLERKDYLHKKEMERMQRWLDRANFEKTNIESKLRTIFTKGQIQKLITGSRKQLWSEEDIANAISLYTISGPAYQSLIDNNYPLPSIRTLQHWARKSYLAQRKEAATPNANIITVTHKNNDEPIYEELENDENISEMIQNILEEDNEGNVVDDLIEETLVEQLECDEGEILLVNNDDNIDILNDNESETIVLEVLNEIEVVNMDVE